MDGVLECRGRRCDYGARPLIMGILNVTDDSFFDGGRYFDVEAALAHARRLLQEGADMIDVGGQSTRPGYTEISVEDEIARVLPIVETLVGELGAIVSIDTYKPRVAECMLEAGAHILNDIWGFQYDRTMASVAASYDCPVVLMHNAKEPDPTHDIIDSILFFFDRSLKIAEEAGIYPKRIVLDPGIGFGKTQEQNVQILKRVGELTVLGYPLLLGASRKSVLGTILDLPVEERLEGTLATTVAGVLKGVRLFRVHDVKENLRAARVAEAIRRGTL